MNERNMRLSQTITPFGVGAIYVVGGESFAIADHNVWPPQNSQDIKLERLSESLEVGRLRTAPLQPNFWNTASVPKLPVSRFPKSLFCTSCRKINFWTRQKEIQTNDDPPKCSCLGNKSPRLTPMRWVLVCEKGHLEDVPWKYWSHSGPNLSYTQRQCQIREVRFETSRGGGSGLQALKIVCATCSATRHIGDLIQKDAMRFIGHPCSGKQPWETDEKAASCDATPQTVQSGAGNVYFPKTRSAIDIPPESNFSERNRLEALIENITEFGQMRTGTGNPAVEDWFRITIADKLDLPVDEINPVVDRMLARSLNSGVSDRQPQNTQQDILVDEWRSFATPRVDQDDEDHFITKHVSTDEIEGPSSLRTYMDKLVLAIRLREVRTLYGFCRFEDNPEHVVTLASFSPTGDRWLPAVEVFGEGIFISFDSRKLKEWASADPVSKRASLIEKRRQNSFYSKWLPSTDAGFLFLHTFAHVLIKQLTFQCGYSSASLKERIYFPDADSNEDMAGVLIYTADGDVEGTLGGLVREGEPPRLGKTVSNGIRASMWCSNDPVCSESSGQGIDGLNLAACHACVLISETSCIYSNRLLDRSLFTSNMSNLDGFMDPVWDEMLQEMEQLTGGQ